jgi:hypothetical protein
MKKITKIIIKGMLIFAVQNIAFAKHDDVTKTSDTDKISYLENVVKNLEARVSQLEKLNRLPNSEASHEEEKIDPKSGWKYRKSWLQLKVGMPTPQVDKILGHPTRIDNMGGGFKKFFYWGGLPTGAISGYLEMYEGKIYKIYIPEFHE